MTNTLSATLRALARRRPDDPYLLTVSGSRMSYRELDDRVDAVARSLVHHGARVGGIVAFWATPTLDLLVTMLAVHRSGAVAAMLNPANTARELDSVLSRSSATTLLVGADLPTDWCPWAGLEVLPLAVVAAGRPGASVSDRAETEQGATMIFTSGTTAEPKAVLYTHGHQLHGATTYASNLGMHADDLFMLHFPLFHMNGLNQLGATLVSGARLLLVERFRSSTFDGHLDQYRPTVTFLNATHIKMLREVDQPLAEPSSLERVGTSLQMGQSDYDWFETKYTALLLEGYGQTETVTMCLANPLEGPRKRQSCGVPLPGYEVRIVDNENVDMPHGSAGRLLVRSSSAYGLADGYVGDAEATAALFVDGWLVTGDILRQDKDGYYYYVEREKDIIKRAGENISAGEVQEVIEQLDGVVESAVVAAPDPLREELPIAYVTVEPHSKVTPRDVIDYCRAHLAAYKVPVDVVVLDEFPRTAVGKIEKRTLRSWAAQR